MSNYEIDFFVIRNICEVNIINKFIFESMKIVSSTIFNNIIE